ncbi:MULTISPECIES: DEAD/DEAH box helicase [unclassified Streptomyces]|uniref:DEAD/DEAH box helicase n=2 Tax=unclassified Streptomyces TaxID=2593676 RepID=UPI001164367B|nr:DEAD/DEAH box helicase [Streptomyces sp. RLA2-12]QDN57926.1 DEAD/DEAH box helicase [Streptomyces sp. S1D4-20]QDN68022.1 DEAD/DEAH box helicase [Streptomyces sp. S1D4-14]QDO50437.1 DEAD/DEAH box helicase [Streptomyces sp. RLB3-5]QDO60678.1 DEAD/DEAH box helicase [Streptomyces sp. RLB1-8]
MPPSSSSVVQTVLEQSSRVLQTYAVDPGLVAEHANGERRITQGGYGDRQLFELVQNAADEMADESGGRVNIILTDTHLYCANEGNPVTPEGAETILRMSMSKKRGGQIGRFGVGVKSVLVVTDAPEFFSSMGSFGFDRAWSYEQIKAVPGVTARYGPDFDAPVLRMARPLDVQAERAADHVLNELLDWATTVVRLPLLPRADDRLGRDMHGGRAKDHGEPREEFPVGFQLFSPHVAKVVLEDRRPRPVARRTLTTRQTGDLHTVVEERTGKAAAIDRWRVFSTTHEPGPSARADAGELHDRLLLDLAWGVPALEKDPESGLYVSPRSRGRGRFWSFFPTKYEMSLSGILNGAWKTNEDRQNLLDSSPFNQEMIRVSAKLVVDSLPALAPAEDPAAYLPLLPGRVKEAISWADEFLTREVWARTTDRPSLPDQDGVLRVPTQLRIPPRLDRDLRKLSGWLRMWNECPGRPSNWLHPSAEADALRSGKVEHIIGAAGHERTGVREWLEALVESGTPEASAVAIRILADMIEAHSPYAEEARTAHIVLTEEHGLIAPVHGKVFRRADQGGLREALVYVVDKLAEDPSLAHSLNILGIREADVEGRFVSVLDQGFDHYSDSDWERFWELFRQAGVRRLAHKVLERVPTARSTLRVRTADGRFRPVENCMLPGAVVDAKRDPSIAVDMAFHSDDTPFFPQVGLRERPSGGVQPRADEAWFEEYRAAVHAAYLRGLDSRAPRPTLNRMKVEGAAIGGPLHLFRALSEESRAAFLKVLPDDAVVDNWTLQIGAQTSTRQAVISPIRWMLRKFGTVATSQGIKPLKEAVGSQLAGYRDVLPVADISPEKARRLRLPTTVDEVPADRWDALLDEVTHSEDDSFVGATYVMLTRFGADFPEDSLTRCRIGEVWGTRPDDEITIAVGAAQYRALRAEQLPALLVPTAEDAELMIEKWGMLRYADVISRETREVPEGDPVPLVELFPALRQRLNSGHRNSMVQRCSELEEVTRTPNGTHTSPLDAVRQDGTVKVRVPLEPEPMLRLIDRELGLGLGAAGCRAVLEHQDRIARDSELRAAQKAVREAADVVAKIELLIGADALRAGLPEGLMEAELQAAHGEEPSGRRVAQMAFNAHGDGVLQQHARDIQARFPNAPVSYGGSSAAIAFVSELRLPVAFAGSRTPSPPAFETVEGPRDFPSLHEYQEDLVRNITTMLDRLAPQRGMLSLPTGAGKTRVTAEAVIRWVKRVGDLKGPLLWIAQTEELCEQAVQSWKFVWNKVGAERPLTISRLWSTNEVGNVVDHPHLVVATDAKLERCLGTDQYAWLREAALVIVDEAHTAISKRYTEILSQLGLTQYETGRHLLGLTATPFRNRNEEETRRLAGRFGNRRLDEGVFPSGDPYHDLQDWGMLAQVEHRTLEGGRIELTRDEKTHADRMAMLSRSAEQRLADDHARSRRIVDSVAELPDDWPTLLFATSVDHAKYLAAMLNDRGVRSAAVDSTTSAQDRRTRIENFRSGRIRVLTNYGVLTQGFDAPATRAVVVARPVYSTNVYQQMIGRGLRGPRNGGKESCLILNISDNITNFDTDLAFNEFEHLWSRK